jgi:hypothetical protein
MPSLEHPDEERFAFLCVCADEAAADVAQGLTEAA